MKNNIIIITLGLSALALAACSKSDRNEANSGIKDVYQDSKSAIANTWSDLKDYTYEKRSDFNDRIQAMAAELEAEMSELQANYAEDKASASRRAAMQELKDSRADLSQKLDALGNATADTWGSAKANVIAAWDRTEAAYKKAKADAS
jgi:Skp family chaperone for outer membrane proteins